MGITEQIAIFISETHFDNIPKDAISLAKRAFLDCLGVALAGSREPVSKIIQQFLLEVEGKPTASMIGTKIRTSSPWAALANGTIAHALDYDDSGGLSIPLHPSATVFPVALALGQESRTSGQAVLEAYIVGLEVETKIASVMDLTMAKKGWHETGVLGTLGATAAGSKILHLNRDKIKAALGLAASSSGGLRLNFGTMTKPFHAGRAAFSGVISTNLANKGFTANQSILEDTDGFFDIFGGAKEYDLDNIAGSLGKPFHLISPGIVFKEYACCRAAHTGLDALFELMKEHHFSSQDVVGMQCGMRPQARRALRYDKPTDALQAKFSMQYCLSIAILDGKVGAEQFDIQRINSPEVRKIMEKVSVYVHPDLEEREIAASILTVRLLDGQEYSKRVDRQTGDNTPLSWEKLKAKFESCAGLALPSKQINTLIQMVESMEQIEDIGALVDLAT
ncbi:MmgE/PrpD family protein [Chloroflexota bacterium]